MTRRLSAGSPTPLGVTPRDGGVNVAVFSASATTIEFCLFDAEGNREVARIPLPDRSGDVVHGFLPDVPEGSRYGLRAHGSYDPLAGYRFNANKLLLDPFATVLDHRFTLHPSMFAHANADGTGFSESDSAPFMPKAVVTAPLPRLEIPRLDLPWRETVLYEVNIRGFSMRNPAIPEALRGTFAGLAHSASIAHFRELGVTTLELMPAMAWLDERHLPPLGLANSWGYNPVALLAPDPLLAPGGWAEIRAAISALHAAGLEVILDVVLNHTGEGDALGPTVSLRGLDNAGYYRLHPDNAARYIDDMGCGNCLALDRPQGVDLALAALRTWARAGVDGFRFDLATAMGRRDAGFDPDAPLIRAIDADPELSGLKRIAEAWDIGPGGYQVGRFPAAWGEWNDRYRDTARRFWRGDTWQIGDMATRLAGSRDLFAGKHDAARSINFITAHDGMTLADLVSYAAKHNEANGEHNRDGTDANHSWNHGIEGPTDDPAICTARRRDQINLLATLLFSRGTPMLSMGAEQGQSQSGNNNAYAQDNALGWLDWGTADEGLREVTAALIALRRVHPLLRGDAFLSGQPATPEGFADATWLRPDGEALQDADWHRPDAATLGLLLAGAAHGRTERLLLVLHRGGGDCTFRLPQPREGTRWHRTADTALAPADWGTGEHGSEAALSARSVVLFCELDLAGGKTRPSSAAPELIEALADAAGIYRDWWDHSGGNHRVSLETKRALLISLGFDVASASALRDALAGLHEQRRAARPASPGLCWLPATQPRGFGIAAQLYSLRRAGDQGIGDFSTLALAGEKAGAAGAAALGLNPLHMLFAGDRERASPYHPSDRRFLDFLQIDIADLGWLPGTSSGGLTPTQRRRAAALSNAGTVDYAAVAALKLDALENVFAGYHALWSSNAAGLPGKDFSAFVAAGGPALERFATFRAIEARHPGQSWRDWPDGLADAGSAETARFAARYRRAVDFEMFLQWIAERQFGAAAARARGAGLSLGFYRDLAVGCAPDGAEIWANRTAYATGVSIGAPPDPFSQSGQVWNLPPPNPLHLEATGGALFGELIASNMRHAGLLRIDHVMGLSRLFYVPDGAGAKDGAYVAYPLELMLGVLAEESRRHRCIVVGEDLGTVPDGFREALAARSVLSYRVLWFEREGTGFKPPSHYPEQAVACASTHDLATLAGWWSGADIAERARLGLLLVDAAAEESATRTSEKQALVACLMEGGWLEEAPDADAALTDALAAATHAFVAATPALLAFAQADDLAGETEAVNLPGTDRERPNWRRKLAEPVETLFEQPRATAVLAALARRAPRAPV